MQHSFKPKINLTSEVICAADPKRGVENEAQRIERLYNKDVVKKQLAKEFQEQQVYGEYTFQPKINAISQRIAPPTSIVDRSQNIEGIRKKERLREEVQQ